MQSHNTSREVGSRLERASLDEERRREEGAVRGLNDKGSQHLPICMRTLVYLRDCQIALEWFDRHGLYCVIEQYMDFQ